MKYRIELTNGETIITPDWNTVKRYVNGGDVLTVTINGLGEITMENVNVYETVMAMKHAVVERRRAFDPLHHQPQQTYGEHMAGGRTVFHRWWRSPYDRYTGVGIRTRRH